MASVQFASFTIKNTFIDDVESLDSDTSESPQPSALRCVTAPVPRNKFLDFDVEEDDGEKSTVAASSDGEDSSLSASWSPVPTWPRTMSGDDLAEFLDQIGSSPSELGIPEMQDKLEDQPSINDGAWPRTMSGDDLADFLGCVPAVAPMLPLALNLEKSLCEEAAIQSPPEDSSSSSTSPAAATPSEGRESGLARMVQEECSFLNVASVTLMQLPARSSKNKRVPSGVTRSLRICVHGLPSLKRHKWSQPLAQAVADALESKQCPAMVRRGELFASLDTTEGGEMVRVDLCAPRESDGE